MKSLTPLAPFTCELDLRRWTESQLSLLSLPFSKIEPSLNSTLGLPDYSLQFKDQTLYMELKLLKLRSKIFHTNIRPNQKKQLKRLHKSPNVSVGLLACIQDTPGIFAIRIRPSTILGTYDLPALASNSLALNVSRISDALDFIYDDH
jgi:hypothetical protein